MCYTAQFCILETVLSVFFCSDRGFNDVIYIMLNKVCGVLSKVFPSCLSELGQPPIFL